MHLQQSRMWTEQWFGQPTIVAAAALFVLVAGSGAQAQELSAQLSQREAYIGMPIVLQLTITNAKDYDAPAIPEIDGCDVRSAGAPAQSSQITIFNGRRKETRSVRMQYLITPRRAGTFEVPAIALTIDGKMQRTSPLRFVATKSDTGDLLFVEIEGGQEKVYVGEPLNLKLKIWVKPFRDRQQQITLSEAQMWQLLAQQSSWGPFAERLQDLADNNQRPGGREVLRKDDDGNEHSYYLYEIDATTYPTRPGSLDASDVQIVVNYPTALGKARDPFDEFFKDGPLGRDMFGGNSVLKRMMGDDFFASPFGNRLTVKSSRPVIGEATTDSTQVLPVPTVGRPHDYRGAVGTYRIVTEATPTSVAAGDPITLNIGVTGTGPMELVPAPPLGSLEELTTDFKVPDEPLAGFADGDSKVFSTTIRPRRAGVSEIPAIRFSYFDPSIDSFKTVYSQPISISVETAETLALDAIVGTGSSRTGSGDSADTFAADQATDAPLQPDLTNFTGTDVLESHATRGSRNWWWPFMIVPPFLWLATIVVCNRDAIRSLAPSFQPAKSQCLDQIATADSPQDFVQPLVQFVRRRTREDCYSPESAVGALRTRRVMRAAVDLESLFDRIERGAASQLGAAPVDQLREQARTTVATIDEELDKISAFGRVTVPRRSNHSTHKRGSVRRFDLQKNV